VNVRTPALVVDLDALEHNIRTMAAALPGPRCRPHVKAHKCTSLARLQADLGGHRAFTCATVREVVGMADAGLGDDLLLANEVVDVELLRSAASCGARVTVAVDSPETVAAAAEAGIGEVLIDVDIGLPRCGCAPEDAGRIATLAREAGLTVRGVMGYEGHIVGIPDRAKRERKLVESMEALRGAHAEVGGDVVSSGGTGTYDLNTVATEIQAGSYALMDTAYRRLDLPFRQALFLLTTVISVSPKWSVCDGGLKSLGMDHGDPTIDGADVLFCSDEHITFVPHDGVALGRTVGDRVFVTPAHVDPTVALHDRLHLTRGADVVDTWPVDLRGW
jgi:D-serine deaminase-like pyridoxal phosphate-dependent protein